MKQAKTLAQLLKIRESNYKELKSIVNVLGSALGKKYYKNSDKKEDPAILVYVREKIHCDNLREGQVIPSQMCCQEFCCPTDVIAVTEYRQLRPFPDEVVTQEDKLIRALRGRSNKLQLGSQVGIEIDGESTAGSLGIFVQWEQNGKKSIGFIMNYHAFSAKDKQAFFSSSSSGKIIGKSVKGILCCNVKEWYKAFSDPNISCKVFSGEPRVRVDFAVVELIEEFEKRFDPCLSLGRCLGEIERVNLSDESSMDLIGKKVFSVGRSTGLQRGVIKAFSVDIGFSYFAFGGATGGIENEVKKVCCGESHHACYTDFLIGSGDDNISGKPFATYGDSGSLVVLEDGCKPLGILWGAMKMKFSPEESCANDYVYATALWPILNKFNLKLITENINS